ncbi:DUF2785 domain-containing protein [Dokdonella sp.]|uniref:DUF2785 domain-containing protein n=1 Tax=Dokdonella sp. TaxID=2291710 RepID=UPI003C589161
MLLTLRLFCLALCMVAANASASCPPLGTTRVELQALKSKAFVVPDDATPDRDQLALGLLDCLSDPDPELRDGIAFEGLAGWMRSNALSDKTLVVIYKQLLALMNGEPADPEGFARPFAALVLSEVARSDKERGFLSQTQLNSLVAAGSEYMTSITDYRGFDPKQGWRHGVAHAADLLAALADHPKVDNAGLQRIVAAVGTQVIPRDSHFYIFSEPQRLARPLILAAQRGVMTMEQWRSWLAAYAKLPGGGSLYASIPGLSRRHNLQELLLVLYTNVNESGNETLRESLRRPVIAVLMAIN